jgi:hypothetical protein
VEAFMKTTASIQSILVAHSLFVAVLLFLLLLALVLLALPLADADRMLVESFR